MVVGVMSFFFNNFKKFILTLVLLNAICLIMLISYNIYNNRKIINNFNLELAEMSQSLHIDETTKIMVFSSSNIDYLLTYTSLNPSVAEVNSGGVVTAKSIGTTAISIKNNINNKELVYNIYVVERVVNVEGIVLNNSSLNLNVNGSYELLTTISPTNATNQDIIWSSSDSSVATVEKGVITALKAGKSNIKVITSDGSYQDTLEVKIINSVKIHFIKQNNVAADAILLESNKHFAMIDTEMSGSTNNDLIINYLK